MRCTKIVFCLFTIAFLIISCRSNSQIVKIDDVDGYMIVKGPVKEFEIKTFEPLKIKASVQKGQLFNGDGIPGASGGKYFFDEAGIKLRQISYKSGTTEAKFYFEYKYIKNKLVRRTDYNSPAKTRKILEIEHKYDSNGNLKMSQYFDEAICESKELMRTSKDVFEYNSYNDVIKQIDSTFYNYDCDDIDIDTSTYEYHPKYVSGLKVEDDSYKYEYDKERNMIRRNLKGDIQYKEFYPNGIRKKKFINEDYYFEYNEDGYNKKSVFSLRSGKVYTYQYENMDQYGNWTRMVIYEDDRPYLIGNRVITYYN